MEAQALMNPAVHQTNLNASLTLREAQVVRLLSLGCSVREVAHLLGIAESTTDTHKARAMRKLGNRKSVLLARTAIKLGISSIDDQLTYSEQLLLKELPRPVSRSRRSDTRRS
jgi:DNA-binding CsgD family transcriptional regulator